MAFTRAHLVAIPQCDHPTVSCQERCLVVDPNADVRELDRLEPKPAGPEIPQGVLLVQHGAIRAHEHVHPHRSPPERRGRASSARG